MQLPSLDPKDYFYVEPTPDQMLQQQRLLARSLGWPQPPSTEPSRPVGTPRSCKQSGAQRSGEQLNLANARPRTACILALPMHCAREGRAHEYIGLSKLTGA